jgi:hypothetical protein
MRCYLGKKKIERLKRKYKLPIVSAMVRGNTDHRIDVLLEDGTELSLYPEKKGGDTNGLQGKEDRQGDQEVVQIPSSKGEG